MGMDWPRFRGGLRADMRRERGIEVWTAPRVTNVGIQIQLSHGYRSTRFVTFPFYSLLSLLTFSPANCSFGFSASSSPPVALVQLMASTLLHQRLHTNSPPKLILLSNSSLHTDLTTSDHFPLTPFSLLAYHFYSILLVFISLSVSQSSSPPRVMLVIFFSFSLQF